MIIISILLAIICVTLILIFAPVIVYFGLIALFVYGIYKLIKILLD